MDLDIEFNSSHQGYNLKEDVDFKERVIQYFNILI